MFFHPTQSAQLAALRRARYLDEAAIARMVPRRSSALRRRFAQLLARRRRPESAVTAGRSTPQPRPVGDAAVVD